MKSPILDRIAQLRSEFRSELQRAASREGLQDLRIRYLGRKGALTALFQEMITAPAAERPELGKEINRVKNEVSNALESASTGLGTKTMDGERAFDMDLPGNKIPLGTLHPLEKTLREVKRIFLSFGFSIAYGPEVDDEYHNFEALNIPKYHPARDMQDTFYLTRDLLLRTHTSNTQVHLMKRELPPLRFIVPGRVYRHEDISARSYCQFHQVEGLYVNEQVSLSELKGTLDVFAKRFFGREIRTRLRPSYFPFVEPGAEMDVSCLLCNQDGCSLCKGTGWLEILGAGMVHPDVFRNVGYSPRKWKGFAFGMGIERLCMLKHRIDDIRLFYTGDVRFLRQFA